MIEGGNGLLLSDDGYNIQRSLRFRSSASAYLNRTPASNTNRRISTFSAWFKWSLTGSSPYPALFCAAPNGSTYTDVIYFNNNVLTILFNGGVSYGMDTKQVFRDPAAWYHIVLAIDTTQATASNRVKLYINGSQVTAFNSANYPPQNYDPNFNSAIAHNLCRSTYANDYFDGYLAEVNFIDGQSLTPSSFGQTDAVTGVWTPKKYTGTYGTNGFYLPFSDNTSATTLAYDKSGNGNNWTPNNISTTAGATYDIMTDVPTLTSATAANYCVLNPLDKNTSGGTVSNGNLQWSTPADSTNRGVLGSVGFVSGKWYWEAVVTSVVANTVTVGFVTSDWDKAYVGSTSTGNFGLDTTYGARASSGITISGSTVTIGLNDVIGVAFDADSKTATFYKNNTSIYTFSNIPSHTFFPAVSAASNTVNVNFGQRPFSYTPPTGFKALNTFNLPDPTIKKPNQYMDATLWTGDGTSNRPINSGFATDLFWGKVRSAAGGHRLYDVIRGPNQVLLSNDTAAEQTFANEVTAFTSTGVEIGSASLNTNGATYVGWQWKKGATPGFDIVTYTGTGVNRTVSHSLGVAPSMIIVKDRTAARTVSQWPVYHSSVGNTKALFLNATDAAFADATYWQNTSPTSSVFSVGTWGGINYSGDNFVAYLFAEIAGFSKFGSYTGNGSADGPFVYCGFRPKYVMVKRTDASGQDWIVWDTARPTYNTTYVLYPNGSYAEDTAGNIGDILSNGFKPRTTGLACNANGATYVYACFAENPFKYSLAR